MAVAVALIAGVGVSSASAMWPVVVGGVLAGLAMRTLASGEGSPYARGGVAGLATALAAVIGPMVATQIIHAGFTVTGKTPPPAAAEVADADPPAETTAQAAPEPVAAPLVPTSAVRPDTGAPAAAPDPFQPMPVAMLVVGCLLAYQIGKGVGPGAGSDEDPQPSDGDQPPAAEASDGAANIDAPEQPANA